ncbi:MAG: lysophospholipid acyltransferase family protein [Pseudomonadota bacterium]
MNSPEPDKANLSRRSSTSQRELTPLRRLYFFLGMPVLRGILRLLVSTYRYQPMIGSEHLAAYRDGKTPIAPCYWHQHHVLCSTEIRRWIHDGFKPCYLISGSVDGDVPERIARAWGAEVIRGSANQSGALALRDMQAMMRKGFSIVTTADGPRGPLYEFKAGAVMMARIGGVPILPVAAAADRAWYLKRWDKFMIPKPFARVVIGIGAPEVIDKSVALDALEPHRERIQAAVMSVMRSCEQTLKEHH